MLHQTRFLTFIKRKKVGAKGPLKPNYGPFLIVCYGECCVLMAKTKKRKKNQQPWHLPLKYLPIVVYRIIWLYDA